jgi:hypothetical protein
VSARISWQSSVTTHHFSQEGAKAAVIYDTVSLGH